MVARKQVVALAVGLSVLSAAAAQAQTMTSPTSKGALPNGVSVIGGIVADLVGANGARVVSQLAASQLYVGYSDDGTPAAYRGNPLTIGIQSGFTPGVLSALGGGLSEAAFRISLYDGDTSAGDFDYNENTFQVNGFDFQNFSTVPTSITSSTGSVTGSATGFSDSQLNTGFFYSNDTNLLTHIFAALTATGEIAYGLNDVDPTDNFYDFTQGIDNSLIDVGTGPVVTPPSGTAPEPMSVFLMATGLAGLGAVRWRRRAHR